MKWKYKIYLMLVLLLIMGNFLFVQLAVAQEKESNTMRTLHKHQIHINSPKENNTILSSIIQKKINAYKEDFLSSLTHPQIQPDFTYYLDITYEKYETPKYISYAFFNTDFLGGAHPNLTIWTLVFSIEEEKIKTITDFIPKDSSMFLKLQKNVRSDFLINPKIIDTSMLISGTQNIEDFNNFVYTKKGLLFYFPPYQLAPYSQGTFTYLFEF